MKQVTLSPAAATVAACIVAAVNAVAVTVDGPPLWLRVTIAVVSSVGATLGIVASRD